MYIWHCLFLVGEYPILPLNPFSFCSSSICAPKGSTAAKSTSGVKLVGPKGLLAIAPDPGLLVKAPDPGLLATAPEPGRCLGGFPSEPLLCKGGVPSELFLPAPSSPFCEGPALPSEPFLEGLTLPFSEGPAFPFTEGPELPSELFLGEPNGVAKAEGAGDCLLLLNSDWLCNGVGGCTWALPSAWDCLSGLLAAALQKPQRTGAMLLR